MLILGHVGFTLGLARIAEKACIKLKVNDFHRNYSLVALGSIVPDLIDKPLGHVFLKESLNNGRIFSHTLLFIVLIWIIAMLAVNMGKSGFLSVSFGSAVHLALDEMWRKPETFFWPLYGWSFSYSEPDFLLNIIQKLDKPEIFIPEIMGAAILVLFWIDRRHGKEPGGEPESSRIAGSRSVK